MRFTPLFACLAVTLLPPGSLSAAATSSPEPTVVGPDVATLNQLAKGVGEIASPGLPGTLCVFGDRAFPIVLGRVGRDVLQPAVAGASFGQGRLIAFAHDGFFAPEALKEADTELFFAHCIEWAAQQKPKPTVAVLGDDRLARHLEARGFKVRTADLTALNGVDVLIAEARSFRLADAARITTFIRESGGFITAATGWGWQQLNPGKDLATELPGNLVLAPAGLVFATGELEDTGRQGFVVTKVVPPLTHAGRAFLAAQAQAAGQAPLSRSETAQASASLVAAAHNLPPGDTLLLPRLQALQADPLVQRVPSKESPIKAANLFGRLLVTLDGKALRNQAVELVKAHPAAAFFPGAVPAAAPRLAARKLTLDTRVAGWHSTGLYAAPGEIVTVQVPDALAKQGLRVRLGAHTDTTWHLATWSRFPEITRAFRVASPLTQAASPFGGLVYLEVPRALEAGEAAVTIGGAVAAPHYRHGQTRAEDWQQTLRHHPAPWGELETKKVIVTLPSSVLRDLDDPAALMDVWDRILDLEAELAGLPTDRPRPERIVTDEQISAGYMHSGYPIMTFLDQIRNFSSRESLLKGNWGLCHELGHNHQVGDWTFDGTGEVTCNLFTLFVLEKLCSDRGGNYRHSTPEGILKNYRKLTAGGTPDFEKWKSDPFVALSMYAQLKNEFGWEAFQRVLAEYRRLPRAERPRTDSEKRDQWLVRFSRVVGKNLGPFFQAWSVPVSASAVRKVSDLPVWMPAGFPPRAGG